MKAPGSRAAAAGGLHVDLVGLFFIVWGALTMVIGASTLALGVAAASLLRTASREGGGGLGASLTVATFTTLAVLALAWGAVHLVVGTRVRRLRRWSRMAALMLSSVDLLLLPYGTALGAYALWTLLRPDAKSLFEQPAS